MPAYRAPLYNRRNSPVALTDEILLDWQSEEYVFNDSAAAAKIQT